MPNNIIFALIFRQSLRIKDNSMVRIRLRVNTFFTTEKVKKS